MKYHINITTPSSKVSAKYAIPEADKTAFINNLQKMLADEHGLKGDRATRTIGVAMTEDTTKPYTECITIVSSSGVFLAYVQAVKISDNKSDVGRRRRLV